MELNIKNENLNVCSQICRSKNNFTTECEVIVPDSKPDILKVLQLSARPKVTSCESRGGRVTVSGSITFNILYLADDEEKCVKSITSSCEFSTLIRDDHIGENMYVFTDVDVSDLGCTIANCRKLSLKATLCANVRVYSCYGIDVITDIEGACTKKTTLSSGVICAHAQDLATICDSFSISPGKSPIEEILKSDAVITDSSLKIIDDKAILKGTLRTVILYRSESGIEYAQTDMSFAHVMECDGIREDMDCEHTVKLCDISATTAEDTDGKQCIIELTSELFFRVIARKTYCHQCIVDAYIPHGALDTKHSMVSVDCVDTLIKRDADFREKITLPDSLPDIESVYQVIARPFTESCITEGEKLRVSGYTEVYILYLSRDKTLPACSFKTDIDFSVLCDSPGCMLTPYADCKLNNISYTITNENSVEIRGSVDVAIECIRTTEEEIIYNVQEAEYEAVPRPSIIVSFVNSGRTLWDIAKEYLVSPEDILIANALENEASILPGMALIIPK